MSADSARLREALASRALPKAGAVRARPVAVHTDAPDPKSPRPEPPLRALVVGDSAAARHELAMSLRRRGYACEEADDAIAAAALHVERPFELVVAAWDPELRVLELCRRIRERDQLRRYTYVVVLGPGDDERRLGEATTAGADAWLDEPVEPRVLDARLAVAERLVRTNRSLVASNRELRRDSQRLFRVAHADPLTGVGNRLRLDEDLAEIAFHAGRHRTPTSALLCDIDHFKLYNDRFGHLAGDEVLRRVAATLRGALRESDSLYRYGGEEFLVLLPRQSVEQARRAADRIRAAVLALGIPNPDAPEKQLTISIGVGELAPDQEPTAWLARVDAALYRAKALGRNRCEA